MTKFLSLLFLSLLPIQADLVAHYALDETDPSTTFVLDSLQQNNGVLIGNLAPTKSFAALHGTGYNFPLASGFSIDPSPQVQPTD